MLYTLQLGHPTPCPRDATIDGVPMGNLGDDYWRDHGGMEWHRTAAPVGVACTLSHAIVDGAIVDIWTAVLPTTHDLYVESLRDAYRLAMRQFCAACGVTVVDKMEQVEFERIATAHANPVEAISYTLRISAALNALRDNDSADAWDRI